ncbi:hypothetical protein AVEN_217730-1 [Araneus ventricosus]|uniref:Uncharacterized protein n=1 Tax=Araneus ventricosus TaxID=182803 RepID=A0A4Y2NPZ9_ARAVE|nr:hypothetical protein AVEN_217730-1 [Araneus ventricosus]
MSGVWGFSRRGRIVVKPCSYGVWLGKSVGSARMNGCTDAVCRLPLPLMCMLSTTLTRKTTDAHRFFLFRRWGVTRIADGTCGKTGRRNAALSSSSSLRPRYSTQVNS